MARSKMKLAMKLTKCRKQNQREISENTREISENTRFLYKERLRKASFTLGFKKTIRSLRQNLNTTINIDFYL